MHFIYYLKSKFFWHTARYQSLLLTKSLLSKRNKTKKQNQKIEKSILHVRLTSSSTKHRVSTQCHYSGQIYQRLNTYLILFKVITGLLVITNFHSTAILEKQIALISQLQLRKCFSIGEHKVLLEQLSNILEAFSGFVDLRLQIIGYHNMLFN